MAESGSAPDPRAVRHRRPPPTHPLRQESQREGEPCLGKDVGVVGQHQTLIRRLPHAPGFATDGAHSFALYVLFGQALNPRRSTIGHAEAELRGPGRPLPTGRHGHHQPGAGGPMAWTVRRYHHRRCCPGPGRPSSLSTRPPGRIALRSRERPATTEA